MLNHKSKEEAALVLAEEKACARLAEEGDLGSEGKDTESSEDLTEVKKKKKKRKKEKNSDDGSVEPDNKILKGDDTIEVAASMTAERNLEPVIKRKKSKKSKSSEEASKNETQPNFLLEEEEVSLKKKK